MFDSENNTDKGRSGRTLPETVTRGNGKGKGKGKGRASARDAPNQTRLTIHTNDSSDDLENATNSATQHSSNSGSDDDDSGGDFKNPNDSKGGGESSARKRAKTTRHFAHASSSKSRKKDSINSKASAAAAAPTEFVTGGVRIKFPFAPYKSQEDMMSKIVEALQKQENALLESPTGSGKSLALLCGALAWLESEKQRRATERRAKAEKLAKEWDELIKGRQEQVIDLAAQGPVESPYFSTEVESLPANLVDPADDDTSSTVTSAAASPDCGSCAGNCESEATQLKIKEGTSIVYPSGARYTPYGAAAPIAASSASGSGSNEISAATEKEMDEDDDDFQQTPEGDGRKGSKQPLEIKYEAENYIPLGENKKSEEDALTKDTEAVRQTYQSLPKIYFGSRTHKQITQLVKELKSNTVYRPKMVVLGSRSHYCTNPALKKLVNKNDACQELLDDDKCFRKHRANELAGQFLMADKTGKNKIWDMEDLITEGKSMGACPYFAARSMTATAELIFCPYSYLIDPQIRKAMEINLEDAIVILDEAHNIEDAARDAGGFEVAGGDLEMAVLQFNDMADHLVLTDSCRRLHHLAAMLLNILNKHTKFSIQDYESSTEIWTSQETLQILDGFGLNRHTIGNYDRACQEISKALKEKKEWKKERRRLEMTSRVADIKKLDEEEKKRPNVIVSPKVLREMEGVITIISRLLNPDLDCLDDYKIALVESVDRSNLDQEDGSADDSDEDDNEENSAEGSNKKKRKKPSKKANARFAKVGGSTGYKKKREFKFWCLNPGVIFRPISLETRSVILTSGTLSPLDSFASELQTSFAIQLEADHVINTSQVWAGVIPYGPTQVKIDGTYKSAFNFEFQDELGRVIERIIQTVPHGVLCFVSSYYLMEKLVSRWRATGQYDRLNALKKVMLEPQRTTTKVFDKTLKTFYDHIANEVEKGTDGGALLFAVFRGKCSEGIDFTDSNCRAVLAVSIPFPNAKDLKINLKKEYNDQQSLRRRQQNYARLHQPEQADLQYLNHSTGVSLAQSAHHATAVSRQHLQQPRFLLSGKRWYEIQAFRAYNQAIGRCIRHRKDWGAMILLDHRFSQPHNQQSLSKWVRPLVKSFRSFEQGIENMNNWIAPLKQPDRFNLDVPEAKAASATSIMEEALWTIDIGVDSDGSSVQGAGVGQDIFQIVQEVGSYSLVAGKKDPSHTILDAVKSEDRPSSSGSAAPVVLQEHVDDKCIVKDKIPSSDEILDHFWEPMDEDQGGIDSLADYGDGDWASDVQVDAPPIRKREISSGASSPHTSGTTEQLSTHSQQLYDHTWSLDEYGNLKLNKREGTGKDVALEQPKLPPQLQRMMSIDDVDQQQRSNEDDIWDPALEADFSAELDAELDAVFDADIDDDDDMKSVNVTVDLDVNFDTDVDDDDDMRSANVTAELDAGFADEDFGNAVGVEVRDATNVVGHMLPSSPNPAEKEVAARDTTSTGPNSGFGASSTARGVVTSPPASVPTPAGTRSVRKRSDSMGHPASPSTPRTPKRAPSISTFPIPPFPIFSPKRSPFSSPRKQTSFQDPISSPMSPPSKRSLFQYRLPSAPPKSPLAQFGRRTSVASPTPSAPTTPTTKRTSVLDLAVGPRGQSRLVLKASSHVVCKTCGEPLLVCSARPRIKSVQKSMASEMLLNRRRLTAAQDPGSSSTPATTIGGGPALKRTLSDDLANPFLVNPFLVNPFVVKSEIGLATGALPPSQQQHQSMILTLRGTDVLEKLFDQAQNETEEMDCVWRPQDGLFYRRIMCRNCCISTDLTSTSTSTPAPAAATQDLRLIPGWKGVMIVGRSNGQQAAIDESTEEIGMIWLTPGEISVL